jgi:hypothetical protein
MSKWVQLTNGNKRICAEFPLELLLGSFNLDIQCLCVKKTQGTCTSETYGESSTGMELEGACDMFDEVNSSCEMCKTGYLTSFQNGWPCFECLSATLGFAFMLIAPLTPLVASQGAFGKAVCSAAVNAGSRKLWTFATVPQFATKVSPSFVAPVFFPPVRSLKTRVRQVRDSPCCS